MFTRGANYYKNRITLLEGRADRDNAAIIQKLKRKLRKINSNR